MGQRTTASFDEGLLLEILSQPSSPFRETHVQKVICDRLTAEGVPWFMDPIGNLVLGVDSKAAYRRLLKAQAEPLRIFVAHMDHPGFHGAEWHSKRELSIRWHGGSPFEHLEGARVWIADDQGLLGHGEMREARLATHGKAIESARVVFESEPSRKSPAERIFGGLSFRAPVWRDGDLYYTKAADDLVGSFSIVSLAIETWGHGAQRSKSKSKSASKARGQVPFIGLLTRAEEVGFIGAIGHFKLGWLKGARRRLIAVSLETSRQLSGAEIGKGPVVRLGDRAGVFSPGPTQVLTELAARLLPGGHQRRIMDGGTCEATAALVFGLETIAMSVPLGNYHNQSIEGGPDSRPTNGPAPEFVHRGDVKGLLELCRGIISPKLPWGNPWAQRAKDFKGLMKKYGPLIRSGKTWSQGAGV